MLRVTVSRAEWRRETKAPDSQSHAQSSLSTLQLLKHPAGCLGTQISHSAHANQMALEGDINHVTTLGWFRR